MNVLIVDDEEAVRRTFVRALTQAGYTCHEAATVDAALELLGREPMDAIVCDFAMPGMDGTTFHQRLRDSEPGAAGRLIFVTGWGEDRKTRDLLAFTGRPVLSKPVEIQDLIAAVRAVAGG